MQHPFHRKKPQRVSDHGDTPQTSVTQPTTHDSEDPSTYLVPSTTALNIVQPNTPKTE